MLTKLSDGGYGYVPVGGGLDGKAYFGVFPDGATASGRIDSVGDLSALYSLLAKQWKGHFMPDISKFRGIWSLDKLEKFEDCINPMVFAYKTKIDLFDVSKNQREIKAFCYLSKQKNSYHFNTKLRLATKALSHTYNPTLCCRPATLFLALQSKNMFNYIA